MVPGNAVQEKKTTEETNQAQQKDAQEGTEARNVSPYELAELLKTRAKEILILDSRSKEEYDAFHLENAINIDYTDIEKVESELKVDKTKQIIIYCTMGNRSNYAANTLRKIGYKNASNVIGGLLGFARMMFNSHEIDRKQYDDLIRRISGELGGTGKKHKILAIIRIFVGILFIIIGIVQRKQDPLLIFITFIGVVSLAMGVLTYFAGR